MPDAQPSYQFRAALRKIARIKDAYDAHGGTSSHPWDDLDFEKHRYRWMTTLPDEIGALTFLRRLDLDGHPITDLSPLRPSSIWNG